MDNPPADDGWSTTLPGMTNELEMRVAALEERIGRVETDASIARQLSSAVDHDISEITVRLDGVRRIVNGLGQQTAERFARLEARMDRLEMRMDRVEARMDRLETRMGGLETRMGSLETRMGSLEDAVTDLRAGQTEIIGLLTRLVGPDTPEAQE